MKTSILSRRSLAVAFIPFLLITEACLNDHVVFTTSTRFALDISQQADQPPKILLGYKREEGVFLPSPHKHGTEITEIEETDLLSSGIPKNKGKDSATLPIETVAKEKTSTQATKLTRNDTYSVVSFFCVMANPSLWDSIKGLSPFSKNVPDGLQIHSFFATGLAAQHAAENKDVRAYYQQASEAPTDRAEKRCY